MCVCWATWTVRLDGIETNLESLKKGASACVRSRSRWSKCRTIIQDLWLPCVSSSSTHEKVHILPEILAHVGLRIK